VTRLVDLDDAAGLELAWMELRRRHAIRDADPALRHAILRRCDRLDQAVAQPIRDALDELHPEVVLAAFLDVLAPDRPTIGAVIRHRERP
jgi:hypothetical protein